MYGYFAHVWVVFLQLDTLRSIFLVFGGDVTTHASYTAAFLLCALKDYLNTVSFFFAMIKFFLS